MCTKSQKPEVKGIKNNDSIPQTQLATCKLTSSLAHGRWSLFATRHYHKATEELKTMFKLHFSSMHWCCKAADVLEEDNSAASTAYLPHTLKSTNVHQALK